MQKQTNEISKENIPTIPLDKETIDEIVKDPNTTLIKITGKPGLYAHNQILRLTDDYLIQVKDIEPSRNKFWEYFAIPYNKK